MLGWYIPSVSQQVFIRHLLGFLILAILLEHWVCWLTPAYVSVHVCKIEQCKILSFQTLMAMLLVNRCLALLTTKVRRGLPQFWLLWWERKQENKFWASDIYTRTYFLHVCSVYHYEVVFFFFFGWYKDARRDSRKTLKTKSKKVEDDWEQLASLSESSCSSGVAGEHGRLLGRPYVPAC